MKRIEIPEEIIDIALSIIKNEDAISISFLQRNFPYYISYDLAEQIILTLENKGIIGMPNEKRQRKILKKSLE